MSYRTSIASSESKASINFQYPIAIKLATNYDTNSATRTKAYQLSCATSTIGFIVCLKIIAKYSKILEPIVNKLQAVDTNLHTVHQHIHLNLLEILKKHRSMSEENFSLIFNDVRNCAIQFNLDIQIPRVVSKQTHRQNIVTSTPDEYFRISIYIPYIDSLIQSLEIRFSPINEIAFKLGFLHPSTMLKMTKINFIDILKELDNHYQIENLVEEGQTWYDYWEMMIESSSINEKENISFFLKDCEFYPTVKKSIIIYMTIPPTTCSTERTFSTLRRVKTWLRSTMCENRLSELCMLSLHRKKIEELHLAEKVVDEFGKNKRKLQFVFN
ncbi:uncharacterized protein LOC111042781 [Myzus persicae]|uniref:uncharacterized protein LOC111042781 n=1 Tax=Myzus persicae TaxID=13164 RepID=UPI000B935BAC|nr:uncharacterized protein LOC111042781 [Myzus persicae]